MSVFCEQGDGYNLDFESDDGGSCSSASDDDVEVILKGKLDQSGQLQRRKEGDDDESDFEKEMDMELDRTVKDLEMRRGSSSIKPGSSTGKDSEGSTCPSKRPAFYDDDYFDSDSEDDDNDVKGASNVKPPKEKKPVISNDDLFYDPDQDDDNQKWMDQMRQKHQPASSSKTRAKRAQNSDAILNCPACMVTVCVDCQRHEMYKNQYRAMFVMNCDVNKTEVLRYPKENSKKKRNKKRRHDSNDPNQEEVSNHGLSEGEAYHPVNCSECTTEIGVMDTDEVYHFFNVLASYA